MKVRNGFVSNSSSSSFIIYGTEIEDVKESAKKLYNYLVKNYPEKLKGYESFDIVEDDPEEFLMEFDDFDDFEYHSFMGDWYYIGKCPTKQPDDMTHGEWKKQIKNKLSEIFDEDINVGWHQECWYDG